MVQAILAGFAPVASTALASPQGPASASSSTVATDSTAPVYANEGARLVADARQHIGQPYKWKGSGRWGGWSPSGGGGHTGEQQMSAPIDCIGLVWVVFTETGNQTLLDRHRYVASVGALLTDWQKGPPPFVNPQHGPYDDEDLTGYFPIGDRPANATDIAWGTLNPGDLIIFRDPSSSDKRDWLASHVAIFAGMKGNAPMIVHATTVPGGVAETDARSLKGSDHGPLHVDSFLLTGLVYLRARSDTLPLPPIGAGKPCSPSVSKGGYDFAGIGCATVLSYEAGTGTLWAHPINGQKIGRVRVNLDLVTNWADITKFIEAGNLDGDFGRAGRRGRPG